MKSTVAQVPPIAQSFRGLLERQGLNELARDLGVVQRQGKVDLFVLVLTLLVGSLSARRRSYRQLAQDMHAVGGELVSPQAIGLRLGDWRTVDLLTALGCRVAEALAAKSVGGSAGMPPWLQSFAAVWATDATGWSLHPALAGRYAGSGGCASAAGFKIHGSIDAWLGGVLRSPWTHGRHSDTGLPLADQAPKGTLHLLDQGYGKAPQYLYALAQQQQYFLTPLFARLTLRDLDGSVLHLRAWLRSVPAAGGECAVWLCGAKAVALLPVRLLALPVPKEVADRRRQRAHRDAQRRGRTPSNQTLQRKGWMLWLTNVPTQRLTVAQAGLLYRLRWQVELTFKRWKSLLGLRNLCAYQREPALACQVMAALVASLLLSFVQEAAYGAWRPERDREPSLYRIVAACAAQGPLLLWALTHPLEPQAQALLERLLLGALWGGRMERRRRRLSTRQALWASGQNLLA